METYTFDPNKKKEETKERSEEKFAPVVSTKVEEKKKSAALTRLTALFIPEDVEDIKGYLLKDIVVPSVKRLIIDSVKALLGEEGSTSAYSAGRLWSERVQYGSYYRGDRRPSYKERDVERPEQKDLKFNSRGDAESVLMALEDAIHVYGTVRVNDFYDFADRGDLCTQAGVKYGWKDLHSAKIISSGSGYVIKLPKAFPLD